MTLLRGTALVASLAMVAAAMAGCGLGDDKPSFESELADYGESGPKIIKLDGGVRLAIGSTDEDEVSVQWRGPDEDDWSEPEEVLTERSLLAGNLTVEDGGETAAIGMTWEFDDDEQDSPAQFDAVVCRPYECSTLSDVTGTPMVSSDGEFAAVVTNGDAGKLAIWEPGEKRRAAQFTGPPFGDEPGAGHEDPLLLDDGSFATVAGRQEDKTCVYDLWVSAPRSTELQVVASSRPRQLTDCAPTGLQGPRDSRIVAGVGREAVTFVRSDDTWAADEPKQDLLVTPVDGGKTGIAMTDVDLADDTRVAVGSPDLRTIVSQWRAPDSREWSRPSTVVTAPPGTACRIATGARLNDTSDVMYVVSCWPKDAPYETEPNEPVRATTAFVLASPDGKKWTVRRLDDPDENPEVHLSAPLLLVKGAASSLVWRPGAEEFQEIRLPLDPFYDGIAITRDRREVVRVIGNSDAKKPCRPAWTTARIGDRQWRPERPFTSLPPDLPSPSVCYGVAGDVSEPNDGEAAELPEVHGLAVVIYDGNWNVGGDLVRVPQGWRFRRTPGMLE